MRWFRKARERSPDIETVRRIVEGNVVIAARMNAEDHASLCELTGALIARKRWEPIGGIALTDEILVTIAANAAIPILTHGIEAYRGVHSILVHPTTRRSRGQRAGPTAGVFTNEPISAVGEASPNAGPLSISWAAALSDSRTPARGRNVVIHEFAHKIDMLDGYTDGTPPLRGTDLAEWGTLLRNEYERLEPVPSDEVLRPYAWTNPAEFFAVSTEAFFCTPVDLREAKPYLYDALAGFYGLDPARSWRNV